jgi:hypothetical protein
MDKQLDNLKKSGKINDTQKSLVSVIISLTQMMNIMIARDYKSLDGTNNHLQLVSDI